MSQTRATFGPWGTTNASAASQTFPTQTPCGRDRAEAHGGIRDQDGDGHHHWRGRGRGRGQNNGRGSGRDFRGRLDAKGYHRDGNPPGAYEHHKRSSEDGNTEIVNQLFNKERFTLEEVNMHALVTAAEVENEHLYRRQLCDILQRLCTEISKDFHVNRTYVMMWVRRADRLIYFECLADMFCTFVSSGVAGELFHAHLDALQEFAKRGGGVKSANNLTMLVEDLRKTIPRGAPRRPRIADNEHTYCRYGDVDVAEREESVHFDLPTSEDFFVKPKTDMRDLPCVQVDAPIQADHVRHHLSVQFQLLREDCSRGLKSAIQVFTTAVEAIRFPFRNQRNLMKMVKSLDEGRNAHPMFNISCMGISFHMDYGIVFSFRIPGRNGRKQRGLMPGNLLALGIVNNERVERWLMGLIVPFNSAKDAQPKTTYTDINFFLLNGDGDNRTTHYMNAATAFVGLESSAFYCSYATALKVLSEFCASPPLPFFRPLFELVSNDIPFYLEEQHLDIAGLIATKDGFNGMLNPVHLNSWVEACEGWTFEKENAMRERNEKNPLLKYCHVVDETQLRSLHHIFTHRLAVVQGTPGTGKSFVGVKAIQILLKKAKTLQANGALMGPILITALTNHAVDEVLSAVLSYLRDTTSEPSKKANVNMLRLGSGTRIDELKEYRYPNGTYARTPKLRKFMEEMEKVKSTSCLYEDYRFHFCPYLREIQLAAIQTAARPYQLLPSATSRDISYAAEMVNTMIETGEGNDTQLREILGRIFSNTDINAPPKELSDALRRAAACSRCGIPKLMELWFSFPPKTDQDLVHAFLWKAPGGAPAPLANLLAKLSNLLNGDEKSRQQAEGHHGEEEADNADSGDEYDAAAVYEREKWDTRAADLVNLSAENVFAVNHPVVEALSEEILTAVSRSSCTNASTIYGSFTAEQRKVFLRAVQISDNAKARQKLERLMGPELKEEIKLSQQRTLQNKVEYMKEMAVIGGTVNGMLNEIECIRALKPRILVVEEAAEVMEGHTLALLTSSVEHLILIGDHKQLSPKAEEIDLRRKNLEVSLQERLVLSGSSFVTLTTQRRMHPFVSQIVHPYYLNDKNQPVQIEDHPSTNTIPYPVGVQGDKRGYLISYSLQDHPNAKEQMDEGSKSYSNAYEADVMVAMVTHLVRYNPAAEVIALVAYTQQLHLVSQKLKNFSRCVRLRTIDDFQGEEGDFVLISTVRTERPGFLSIENRACVALSRARRAFYVVGYEPMLQSACSIYQNMIKVLRENDCIGNAFPAVCPEHDFSFFFTTVGSYRENHCTLPCHYKLACGHVCLQKCHSMTDEAHANYKCMLPCERVGSECRPEPRLCDHPCDRLCYQDCPPCSKRIPYTCSDCGHTFQVKCSTFHNDPDTIQCENMVTVQGEQTLCGHSIAVRCCISRNQELIAQHCKLPCEHHLECGHLCRLQCHMTTNIAAFEKVHEQQCKECTKPVTATLPCGHKAKKPCNQEASTVHCPAACEAMLRCGHVCVKKRCGHPGAHECDQRSEKVCAVCGHAFSVRCSEFDTAKCPRPCGAALRCGHVCKAPCGECRVDAKLPEWAQHAPCKGCCDKALPCGHRCKDGCGVTPCGPCQTACTFWCGHGRSCEEGKRHKCSECPAMRCNEPCLWACPHHRCNKRCHEPCDRPVCDEPCPKMLPCRHPCPGVCGEVCPRHCPICYSKSKKATGSQQQQRPHFNDLSIVFSDPKEVECFLRGEGRAAVDEEEKQDGGEGSCGGTAADMRLVELPCCSTLTVVRVLDQYIASKQTDRERRCISVNDMLVKCPFSRPDGAPCRQPFLPWYYRRQSRAILLGYESLARMNDMLRRKEMEHKEECSARVQQWAHTVINMLYPPNDERASDLLRTYDEASACTLLHDKNPRAPEFPTEKVKPAKKKNKVNAAAKQAKAEENDRVAKKRSDFFDLLFRNEGTKTPIPIDPSCQGMLELLFFHSEQVQRFFTERFFVDETAQGAGQQHQSQRDILPCALALGLHILDLHLLRVGALKGAMGEANGLQVFKDAEEKYVRQAFHEPLNPQYRREVSLQSWTYLLQLAKASCATQICPFARNQHEVVVELTELRAKFGVDETFFVNENSGCSQLTFLAELRRLAEPVLARAEPIVQVAQNRMPSPEFVRSIRAAMTNDPGHLYMCPNHHFYFIGECGGAMEESKCPDCGAKVGGQQHRSAEGNTFAGAYINPGATAPWPQ